MTLIRRMIDDCISLVYPRLCLACGHHLPPRQTSVCVSCQYHLPKTNFHLEKENRFTERFWGRIDIHTATALYYFSKGGRTQQLIHQLKYNNKPEVGFRMGKLLGEIIAKADLYNDIDLIVPIPLHTQRKKFRGYNQSDVFAKGLSEAMHIPWAADAVIRKLNTATQTKRSRMDRFNNVADAFKVTKTNLLEQKHILLVDDVLTTGATLEACATKILAIPNTKISMATIAFAEN